MNAIYLNNFLNFSLLLHCLCVCSGILKATEFRNRCLQLNLALIDTMGSEDCLYLNIWVPHEKSGKDLKRITEYHKF